MLPRRLDRRTLRLPQIGQREWIVESATIHRTARMSRAYRGLFGAVFKSERKSSTFRHLARALVARSGKVRASAVGFHLTYSTGMEGENSMTSCIARTPLRAKCAAANSCTVRKAV
jgi:hypothetical protein